MNISEEYALLVRQLVSNGWQLDKDASNLLKNIDWETLSPSDLVEQLITEAEKQALKLRVVDKNIVTTVLNSTLPPTPTPQTQPDHETTLPEEKKEPPPLPQPSPPENIPQTSRTETEPKSGPVEKESSMTVPVPSLSSEPPRPAPSLPPEATRSTPELTLSSPSEPQLPQATQSVGTISPFAAGIESRVKVIKDPSNIQSFGVSVNEFHSYFQNRFEQLRRIFQERPDGRAIHTLSDCLAAKSGMKMKVIVMIMDKREREDRLFLTVDDLSDSATVLVDAKRTPQAYETAAMAPRDQVVCIEAAKSSRGDLLIAETIILPDVPDRKPKTADEEIYAALLSDIHVGSKKFLEDTFNRVILWLNRKTGNSQQVNVAGRTKYVIIAGDLIDGIGVYPGQEKELRIPDIYEQYTYVAKFISQIPDYMEVIIIPGNHDGVRQALPQPAILRDFAEPVYEARKIISLGNPAEVELHGVHFLLHHGRSLEDILTSAPGMKFERPEKAMKLQLRCRHLAPEYGNRTSIAPTQTDHLIIEKPPDVFQSGHIHVYAQESYRGTLIINSGAWQGETDYQRRIGLKPNPGILPIVNLKTLNLSAINFNQ